MHHYNKILNVLGVNTVPVALWLSDVESAAVILSALVAIAYTVHQFVMDYRKNKKEEGK
jgi:hypothetical protein